MKDKFNNAVGPQVQSRKKSDKLIPLLSALSLLVGLSSATQFFAYDFKHQSALGSHFHHLYLPWKIIQWASQWYSLYPDAFMRAGGIGITLTSFLLLCLIVIKRLQESSSKPNEYLYGSARWANKKDIQSAGLIPPPRTFFQIILGKKQQTTSGVYVGAWVDERGKYHYLRHNGPEHVLCYAPTRSGKGVGLVLPTLLSWSKSAVVTDLKGELWALTAGWRQKHAHNKVLRFEPASVSGSICWNPLDEIRLGTEHEVGDVQNLATLIVDPDGKGLENHWQKTSQSLLVGIILHALYKAKADGGSATFSSIDAMLSDPNRNIAELWMEMVAYKHVDDRSHPVIAFTARDMMDRPEEEAGSVLSTTKSYLSLYRDPIVARNVGKSEFKIKDLMHHDDPVTLYIVTQPNDKARLRPLVRVMVNMIIRLLADKLEFEKGRPVVHYKHRLLMMLDEFPSLGKLDIMQESLAFVAGYGIKCYLVCQDLNQLKSRETGYGPDESITSNCHIQNAYPPNRMETAEHLSKSTGTTTVIKEQVTTSGKRASPLLGHMSRTLQEVQRPLLTADECLRMPGPIKNLATHEIIKPGDMVIYVNGRPAIYGKQPLYFKDPIFVARSAVPTPQTTDKLRFIHEVKAEQLITL